MSSQISLVFLGGIADSGKSDMMEELKSLNGVRAVRISDYFKDPLNATQDPILSAGAIYRDWKSEAEAQAVASLCKDIRSWRENLPDPTDLATRRLDTIEDSVSDNFTTLIVNTHFATYSP